MENNAEILVDYFVEFFVEKLRDNGLIITTKSQPKKKNIAKIYIINFEVTSEDTYFLLLNYSTIFHSFFAINRFEISKINIESTDIKPNFILVN